MNEPDISQEPTATIPGAREKWTDVIRQHLAGSVFSLAFHILLLVVLGIFVTIVPRKSQEDSEPVQIKELEPEQPPPPEEPKPAEETRQDESGPSLDRYDSSDMQQMDEVGVPDMEMMVDMPTPIAIPDNNSALKLRGVLPFGRPGGGGSMGDGGDGNGRGNLQGMLQGVFYDLKQTKDRRATEIMGDPNAQHDRTRDRILPVIGKFVRGGWDRKYDGEGRVHYPELDGYYCSPTRLWNSCFYTPEIDAAEAPAAFQCADQVRTAGGWVCIYSGNVVAPFSGKFRFVGFCDDVLLIRFNKEIVFEYGWYSYTLGVRVDDLGDYHRILGGSPGSERERRLIADSPLYSRHKLEVYRKDFDNGHGLAKGPVLEVEEGQVYPIEILISEIPGGEFNMVLFVEQLDAEGKPLEPDPERFTLFQTTLEQPEEPRGNFPKFKPYAPVWRVVRSSTSSGSGAGGTITGSRTTPRTARVNEDDEDLSL